MDSLWKLLTNLDYTFSTYEIGNCLVCGGYVEFAETREGYVAWHPDNTLKLEGFSCAVMKSVPGEAAWHRNRIPNECFLRPVARETNYG